MSCKNEIPKVGEGYYFMDGKCFGIITDVDTYNIRVREWFAMPAWKVGELVNITPETWVGLVRSGKIQDMNPNIRRELEIEMDEMLSAIQELLGENA